LTREPSGFSVSLPHVYSFVDVPVYRFLKQPAEKLKAVFVAFDKERRIPAVGASTEDVDIN